MCLNTINFIFYPSHELKNVLMLRNPLGFDCRQHDNPADFFLNIVIQEKQTGDICIFVIYLISVTSMSHIFINHIISACV